MQITEMDRYLFHEGTHTHVHHFMGAQIHKTGVTFTTWAPHAKEVRVVGDFNQWDGKFHSMKRISPEGVWSLDIKGVEAYAIYKFEIFTENGKVLMKSDPFAYHAEVRPDTASMVYPMTPYDWTDEPWMKERASGNILEKPISIYEVNLSSWKRDGNRWLNYKELADELIPYALEHGFTHLELMPIMEHPYDGSWGYQITGYFAVTSRYGSPHDLMRFVDECHKAGLGVILDWVPGHYCKDAHGLAIYDGSPLYEPSDPILRENIEWGTMNFDYGRPEVRAFLISNANFWLDTFHVDGLRVDAVAYMLHKHMATGRYDIYSEKDINDDAVRFLQQLNTTIFGLHKNVLMIAEESSAFPLVTRPVHDGGLGFNLKWNMGWMHDTLKYMETDPLGRKFHHEALTFSIYYAFSENFMLPLSHDEVVHGKKSLIGKMPGDYWKKFANLRLMIAYQHFHPGKKLNFMGNEFAQFIEWNEWDQLDWHLLEFEGHRGFNTCFKAVNHLYKTLPQLHQVEHEYSGFEWIEFDNSSESIIAFKRKDKLGNYVIAVFNFTPVVRESYPLKVVEETDYFEIFNSDDKLFYGSGILNNQPIKSRKIGEEFEVRITLPPLGAILLKPKDKLKGVKE
ncbi:MULTISPECIES: 1,4-alpha-glucan branching protein GlgB [unclassified Fusibacter]|uniref:1,4-alpha-glucan branching protein GlgB n=1 Tax=unclassified Fusibacter TaxID=2624464 RepID=UPI0019D70F52|nr:MULTISPECIES: 1,4-alpha-glucan branching protein GlgB [unclassified Fusibacter]MCK8061439.1 1,4-alpha-glucan branching protein GlgB [Fusibacter sp. A2]